MVIEKYVLPTLDAASASPPRIWSAVCSSGQEIFTLSLFLCEYCRKKLNFKLVASQVAGTDIFNSVLAQARRAVYALQALARGPQATVF